MMNKYSHDIADAFEGFLTDDSWRYDFNEKKGIFRFGLTTSGKLKTLQYHIVVGSDDFTLYATCGIGAAKSDQDALQRMSEFLTRANYGMKCGNFEMDMDDGEIRFKVHQECGTQIPETKVIRFCISCAANAYERYEKGILGVALMDGDPKQLCEECENNISAMRARLEALLAEAESRSGASDDDDAIDGDEGEDEDCTDEDETDGDDTDTAEFFG